MKNNEPGRVNFIWVILVTVIAVIVVFDACYGVPGW